VDGMSHTFLAYLTSEHGTPVVHDEGNDHAEHGIPVGLDEGRDLAEGHGAPSRCGVSEETLTQYVQDLLHTNEESTTDWEAMGVSRDFYLDMRIDEFLDRQQQSDGVPGAEASSPQRVEPGRFGSPGGGSLRQWTRP